MKGKKPAEKQEMGWWVQLDSVGHIRKKCATKARTGSYCQVQPCCMKDEGRPLGAGLQEQASNHLVLLRLKRRGGERPGKGDRKNRQVSGEKMSASEPLMTHRKSLRSCQN